VPARAEKLARELTEPGSPLRFCVQYSSASA
jgi:hypothetical protein